MTFTMDDQEVTAAKAWMDAHETVCVIKETGAIGGKYTFAFTLTGLGQAVVVQCACGASHNVTNYSQW